MKKILLSTLLLSNLNVLAAEEKINCTVSELEKDKSHFCLIKDNENYYIKEVSSDIKKDKKNKKEGLVFDLYNDENAKKEYTQRKKIKKIKKIPKELFEKEINFENQRGLAILTTDEGELYTTRIGYIQENGHYLDIENNKVEEFKIEEVKNPEKIISMYNIYVLDKNKELWRKSKGEWSKLDIENVYDFTYTEEGLVYILSESGFYYGEDKGELNNLQLMNINIEESLYKNKINKKDYEEYVIKSIINEKTRINIYKYHSLEEIIINLENEELLNKDFKIIVGNNEIKVRKEGYYGYGVNSYHYRDKVDIFNLMKHNFRDVENKNLSKKYSLDYNTYFIIEPKNIIETKYNGNVLFNNQEKEIQYSTKFLNNPVSKYEIKASIIKSLETETHYFILRSSGMLTIIDKKTKELKEIFNVNRIDKLIDVKILIDPNFKEQYEDNINEYEVLDIEDIDEDEKVFVFEFKDFESLEEENIKKHLKAKN